MLHSFLKREDQQKLLSQGRRSLGESITNGTFIPLQQEQGILFQVPLNEFLSLLKKNEKMIGIC